MTARTEVGKNAVTLDFIHGEVLSYHKHSESYVSGSGGYNNTGVRIRTQEVTHTEFFVKDDKGQEHEVMLRGEKRLTVREGQEVTMIRADSSEQGPVWVYMYVHNTQMEYYLHNRQDMYVNRQLWHWPLLIGLVLYLKYGLIDNWFAAIVFGLLGAFIISMLITSKILLPKAMKKFDAAIDAYSNQIIS